MKFIQKYNSKKTTRGFTLVETLVAISILVLALTGPLTIISQALKASYYSRDQIVAFYLAQESMEYIRNIRDENSLKTGASVDSWLDGIGDISTCRAGGAPSACIDQFDVAPVKTFSMVYSGSGYAFETCGTAVCASPLKLTTTVGGTTVPFGDVSKTQNSIFTRTIWLTTAPGDIVNARREVVVHVRIDWKQGATPYTFTLEDHLTNWKISS
jgi:prepilin-type N-terminal cleavage/methylation domain-containing protein